ncbi:MAG: transcription-repair coupling factor [Clostridia bacterium]|nr:transcription-repair coupling factor [Clostridia bacterium]
MKFLTERLGADAEYRRLCSAVTDGRLPAAANGLAQIHKAAIVAALQHDTAKKIAVLCHDEAAATALREDLTALGKKALGFPLRDYRFAELSGYSREYEQKRIETLSVLSDGDFEVLCLSVDAALQYTLPPDRLQQSKQILRTGEPFDTESWIERLLSLGYTRCDLTEGVGQFSARGGIVDLFPVGQNRPVRVELWGDEIDSLCYFDPVNQRREESTEEIPVLPAAELLYRYDELAATLEDYLKKSKKSLTDRQQQHLRQDIDLLTSGIAICADRYLPFLSQSTVFDYLPDALFCISESGNLNERFKSILWQQQTDIATLLEEGILSKATAKFGLERAELLQKVSPALFLENFPRASYDQPLRELFSFDWKRTTPWSGDLNVLLEDLSYPLSCGGQAVILAGEKRAAQVLAFELNERKIPAAFSLDSDVLPARVTVLCGGLSSGLELPDQHFLVISHRYIAATKTKKRPRPKNAKEIGSLDELKLGDYVVHVSHGIGIFDGIHRITSQGVTKDYIKIRYRGSDVLYVPVTQLDLVSKYIGAATEDGGIRLNKLGSQEWQRTRARVKAAVRDMAKQLTALYAKRMSVKGYAFSEDTDLQNDFERRFEYEETDDQLRCIREIKADMERAVPMDRLLCGDVGFGKTEVALRAAFKCISEGKQCALLVPTTILAMQHYNTVKRRFGELPVTVKMLSRFVPAKEQEKTLLALKRGTVDMIIGTHRMISKDVAFRDLGLVIVDEEQRFGVAQKERLKERYPTVDVLTLSATPIPRTLNMALSGLRDMSSIDEAPTDRQPVQTYVLEQNTGVLIDAVHKELRRGGQVYYLHNRVESIDRCAAKLQALLPEARIGVAHGKMDEDTLSEIWRRLLEHEIDVLVCTTIIETGVDVPNANTLIVERADRMGLAQLHQLRGRVGRSPRRAYAYFCFDRGAQLSEIASKRLEALREYTEFGSGFKIAMRDLEIRGAGSILGGEQHGNMEAVGYDMYLKLLSDAVNAENGIESHEEAACTVDLNISAHIPEGYIPALPARLGIYKRIADIRSRADSEDVIDELCDRFGEPPKPVMGLIHVATVRNLAAAAGITEITNTRDRVLLHAVSPNPKVMAGLSGAFGAQFSVLAEKETVYAVRLAKGQTLTDIVDRLAAVL